MLPISGVHLRCDVTLNGKPVAMSNCGIMEPLPAGDSFTTSLDDVACGGCRCTAEYMAVFRRKVTEPVRKKVHRPVLKLIR